MREYFSKFVSYNRFIEIMLSIIVSLTLYLISKRFDINFLDSTTLEVCDPHRILFDYYDGKLCYYQPDGYGICCFD